jgi:hypothetical protein
MVPYKTEPGKTPRKIKIERYNIVRGNNSNENIKKEEVIFRTRY